LIEKKQRENLKIDEKFLELGFVNCEILDKKHVWNFLKKNLGEGSKTSEVSWKRLRLGIYL